MLHHFFLLPLYLPPSFFDVSSDSLSSGEGGGENWEAAQSMAGAWLVRRERRKGGSKWTDAKSEGELCYSLGHWD